MLTANVREHTRAADKINTPVTRTRRCYPGSQLHGCLDSPTAAQSAKIRMSVAKEAREWTRSGPAHETRPRICQSGTHVTRPWTAPPAQIAKLARDGHTNQEIAAQLYISPVPEWHLGNVFKKLGITSQRPPLTHLPMPLGNSKNSQTPPARVGASAHRPPRPTVRSSPEGDLMELNGWAFRRCSLATAPAPAAPAPAAPTTHHDRHMTPPP